MPNLAALLLDLLTGADMTPDNRYALALYVLRVTRRVAELEAVQRSAPPAE